MRAVAAPGSLFFLAAAKHEEPQAPSRRRASSIFHIRLDAISYDLTSRLVRLVQVYSTLSLLLHQTG